MAAKKGIKIFKNAFIGNTSLLSACLSRNLRQTVPKTHIQAFRQMMSASSFCAVQNSFPFFAKKVTSGSQVLAMAKIRDTFLGLNRNLIRWCSKNSSRPTQLGKIDIVKMQIVFTCNVCQERSSRIISKQAYAKGVVIIRCNGCNNNHLIADNLGWFFDGPKNIEDIIAEKGGKVIRISGTEMEFVPSENSEGFTSTEDDTKDVLKDK